MTARAARTMREMVIRASTTSPQTIASEMARLSSVQIMDRALPGSWRLMQLSSELSRPGERPQP
ncbi:hypothetical protein [Nonomuraea africana]|uniref:Uncharacterized protein n=1 Tax=Nonomuraea africana TaxID=46171 RepID=A0ABR9KEX1_9ACTN|nr:hypothetical protein [Nonomuraea africana]MBE1560555.1 hypothetical protein [Nonomuraea africana]